jgi:hypothetical protein
MTVFSLTEPAEEQKEVSHADILSGEMLLSCAVLAEERAPTGWSRDSLSSWRLTHCPRWRRHTRIGCGALLKSVS